MFASLLSLSRADLKTLKVTDNYSIHRIVYNLFDDVRTEEEKRASVPSGLLYADKGGDFNKREILILSDRPPKKPEVGILRFKTIDEAFLTHTHYRFEVIVNPTKRDRKTGKLIAIRGRNVIADWFITKAPTSWGFAIRPESFLVEEMWVNQFHKSNHQIVQSGTRLSGELLVKDHTLFINSFKRGIGRGRAFGFGLLQITPLTNKINKDSFYE